MPVHQSATQPEEVRRRHREQFEGALGPELSGLLRDRDLTELSVNPDGSIWVQTLEAGVVELDRRLSPRASVHILSAIAGLTRGVVREDRPIFEGRIPGLGFRIAGAVWPVSPSGALFSIRKSATKLWAVEDYFRSLPEVTRVRDERARPRQGLHAALQWALTARRNIVLSGGTSTAKTSLLAAMFQLVAELNLKDRFLLIEEDYPEVPVRAPLNLCRLVTAAEARDEKGGRVDLARLVRLALRLAPDRIAVGETRGAEALPLLRSWATGHDGGFTTVHASSADDTLYRLEDLLYEAGYPTPRTLIARTVHLVVHLKYFEPRHRLAESAVWVDGLDPETGEYRLSPIRPNDKGDVR